MSESTFILFVILIPAVGGISIAALVLIPSWRRKRAQRRLDEMFEADRQWWEDQFRDVGK